MASEGGEDEGVEDGSEGEGGLEDVAGSEGARTAAPPSTMVAISSGRSGSRAPTWALQINSDHGGKNASTLESEAARPQVTLAQKYITWQGLTRLETRSSPAELCEERGLEERYCVSSKARNLPAVQVRKA